MTNSGVKKKILVVDDEKSLRQALMDTLSHEGYDVIGAKDGQEAVSKAISELPDLILLDIIMPRADGRIVLKQIKENEKLKNIKVIFLTNLSDMDKIAEMFDSETPDYLVKSDWGIDDIVEKIREKFT